MLRNARRPSGDGRAGAVADDRALVWHLLAGPDRRARRGDADVRGRHRDPYDPRLHLSVRPRRVRAGRSTLFSFVVSAHGRPLRGVVIRFGHRRARTGRRGRAVIRAVPRRPGRITVVATKTGYRSARATVSVERRPLLRFTG